MVTPPLLTFDDKNLANKLKCNYEIYADFEVVILYHAR
jgi:hypothetical protein